MLSRHCLQDLAGSSSYEHVHCPSRVTLRILPPMYTHYSANMLLSSCSRQRSNADGVRGCPSNDLSD